jgi:hypothetical protein
MPFTVNWSIHGDTGPAGLPDNGTVEAVAMERISVVVPGGTAESIETAIGGIEALRFMVLAASRYTDVLFRVGVGPATALEGPAVMSGDLAQLLGAEPPDTISIVNSGKEDVAVDLLVYRAP